MGKLTRCARIISNGISIAILVIAISSCSTLNQKQSNKTTMDRLQDSLLADKDGNRYLIKKMLDNSLWMTANLKLNIPGSYCYDNAKENCEQYGRLYTWEAAQKGCALLGEGWRLPTREDWQHLTISYGFPKDSIAYRKRAYATLLHSGNSGFNALLGGGRDPDGQYARLDAHGFYWTETGSDSSMALFYNFAKGSQALYEQDEGEKIRAFSVRCVKSIDSLK